MFEGVIQKENMRPLLEAMLRDSTLIAPILRDGIVVYRSVEDPGQVVLDHGVSTLSPKEIFFPQTETLFVHQDSRISTVPFPDRKTVLFGVHPCDVKSFDLMAKVFDTEEYNDPYWVERRKRTIVIGMACTSPRQECFCNWMDIGVGDPGGCDVFVRDAGERYLFESVTEEGEALLRTYGEFGKVSDGDRERARESEDRARDLLPERVDVAQVKKVLDRIFDDAVWDTIHETCLACGICTYVCPTCHCFDIEDEMVGTCGERVRNWDSCMYSCFTLHASGHNPRPTQKERWRQRIMHKFDYFKNNYGEYSCVGCGRCVASCPVNLDIRAVVTDLARKGSDT